MKRKTFPFVVLLLLFVSFMASSLNTYGQTITATSDPFVFGSPIPVPLSFLAFILPVGLIVLVSARRYLRLNRKANR